MQPKQFCLDHNENLRCIKKEHQHFDIVDENNLIFSGNHSSPRVAWCTARLKIEELKKQAENNKPVFSPKFLNGAKVIMVGSHEATFPENQKVWTCSSDSYIDKSGQEVVFLDGFSGCYMCKYLHPSWS